MLKLVKVKNSPNWYIRGTVKGVYVFESTGTAKRDIADRERRKREDKLEEGNSLKFGEAVEFYIKGGGSPKWILDQYNEKTREWGGVLGQFKDTYMSDIGQSELDEASRKAFPNVKPQTLNRQFYTPFIAVWNSAVRKEKVPVKQWSRPRVRRSDVKKTPWFKYEQAEAFCLSLIPKQQDLFIFRIYTGARVTEAIELDIANVDLGARWAVLDATKTENYRGVPLHRAAVLALRNAIGDRKEGPVFLARTKAKYKTKRDASGLTKGGGYIKTSWAQGLSKSGLTGFVPYSTRHTLNNWMILEGIDDTTREAIMGHDNKSTNAIYSDVPQKHLIETIDRLPDFTDFSRLYSKNHASFSKNSAKSGK